MIAISGSAFGQAAAWANDPSSRFWASTDGGLGAVEHAVLKREMPRSAADRTVIGRLLPDLAPAPVSCMYNLAARRMRNRNEGFTSAQALRAVRSRGEARHFGGGFHAASLACQSARSRRGVSVPFSLTSESTKWTSAQRSSSDSAPRQVGIAVPPTPDTITR